MNTFFQKSIRSPYYLIKRLQFKGIRKYGSMLKGRLLDLGCGGSPFLSLTQHTKYVGLERSILPYVSVVAEGTRLPFADESFDSLLCTEVLEHIAEFGNCVNEIHRTLKKDGLAYITTPMTWPMHYEPFDFHRFTRFGLEHEFNKAGFSILQADRIGGIFTATGSLLANYIFSISCQIFRCLGAKNAERIGSIFVLPLNLFFLILSLLDKTDSHHAAGWAILVKK